MRNRPNKNPILDLSRDGDWFDPWGTAMAWGFACAETLYAFTGAVDAIPDYWEYVPSPVGPCVESWEDHAVLYALTSGTALVADVQFAGTCFVRLAAWARLAGRDY